VPVVWIYLDNSTVDCGVSVFETVRWWDKLQQLQRELLPWNVRRGEVASPSCQPDCDDRLLV